MTGVLEVDSTAQLRAALNELEAVRLCGAGTGQAWLPEPGAAATRLSTRPMDRILRLEADDLTCSVEPGVPRAALDAALAERNLWLPCRGGGTMGGLFAGDPWGAAALARPEPRSLLLGVSGVLGDGTCFKSGARVVKSVAGFDLQKAFVGSRGRLFAVTEMHLKLRPRPAASEHFCRDGLELADALELTRALRRARTPPHALALERRAGSFAVRGTITGDAAFVGSWLTEHALAPCADPPADLPPPADRLEAVRTQVLLTELPDLVAALPADAPLLLFGARLWFHASPATTDALAGRAPLCRRPFEIGYGEQERRGPRGERAATVERLETGLKRALDPRGVLR